VPAPLPGGADYDARFDALARGGAYLHGEADLVESMAPTTVLDAGCGTGRVAIELARRGIAVVGVDADHSMIDQARAKAPELEWHVGDLADLAGDVLPTGPFDLVLMAGNVLLFTRPGTEAAVVANLSGVLAPDGAVVAGFSLRPNGYGLAQYDAHCAAAGLALDQRWATWERAPWVAGGDYAVSVHRRT
jgi:SAM-dependent methyltransferase